MKAACLKFGPYRPIFLDSKPNGISLNASIYMARKSYLKHSITKREEKNFFARKLVFFNLEVTSRFGPARM